MTVMGFGATWGSKFLPEDVALYVELSDGMSLLEGAQVVAKLNGAQGRQAAWQGQVDQQQEARRQAEQGLAATRAKLEAYQEGLFSKLFRSDKERARKIEKHSALLRQGEQEVAAGAERIAALRAGIARGEAELAALGAQVAQLQSLQQRASEQLLRMFCAPAWQADGPYQAMQQVCMRAEGEAARARAAALAFGQAKPLLDRASEKLRSALSAVEWAAREGMHSVQEDMHMHMYQHHNQQHHPGQAHHCHGSTSTYSSSSAMGSMDLGAARRRVQKASQAIMEARAHLPNLPHIQEALVNQCLGSSFMGGAVSGMLIVSEAQHARSQISMMLSQVEACRSWVTSNLAAAQQHLAQAEAASTQRVAELDGFRRREAQLAAAAWREERQAEQPSAPPIPSGHPFVQGISV